MHASGEDASSAVLHSHLDLVINYMQLVRVVISEVALLPYILVIERWLGLRALHRDSFSSSNYKPKM
jgi:hypothetical protein